MVAFFSVLPLKRFAIGCLIVLSGCSSNTSENGPVSQENSAPVFSTEAPTSVAHNVAFSYEFEVSDPEGDAVTVSAPILPFWMTFDREQRTLTGQPSWSMLGSHSVVLRVSDGQSFSQQSFQLAVVRGEIQCDQPFGDPATSAYILPYPAGKTYSINQGYCPSNPTWGHTNWFAYDFDMPIGSTVVASRAGQVISVQEDNPDIPSCSGGKENYAFIRHSDGTVMSYIHLKQNGVEVTAGQSVTAGQVLGQSGNSGCSAGPHLHVALFRDGTNFDRQSTLPFNYSNAVGELDANNGLKYQGLYLAQ